MSSRSWPQTADGTVSASRFARLTQTPTRADVTIRASSDPGSPYYAVYVIPGNGLVVQSRDASGDNTGLAVTSHNTGRLSTAVFNSVSVSPLSH